MRSNCAIRKGSGGRRGRRSGFVLLTGGLLAVGLIGFLGLAFDVGYLQWTRRRLQIAADSAAVAGAQELLRGSTNNITTAAKNDSALNGATHGVNGVTVTVNHPPASGVYAADNGSVEAIVAQDAPLFFLTVFGASTTTVKARAVARLGSGPNCVYVMDPTKNKAFSLNGAFVINMKCGTMIDSSDAAAMYLNGAIIWNGPSSVVGGYSTSGAIVLNPAPTTGVGAESDPLAYIPAPAYGPCTQNNFTVTGVATIQPGVYCNGIKITGASVITVNPGQYVLVGGGLSVGGASVINGTGVSFYLTQDATHPYGPVTIAGASSSSLIAPTTGPMAGILFFQDRTIANPPASTITGATNATFVGALYFPTSALTYAGASNGQYTIIVADTLTYSGAANVDNNYASLPGGSPVKSSVVLSE
jgi:Flp pilus assembly protein TadG